MKKIIIITSILMLIITISLVLYTPSDNKKFSLEYDIVEDNVYVYRNINQIINILEHGTGVVYLGFSECKWCRAYVPYLNEVAKENDIEKIYYYNIYKDRLNNTKEYQKIVSILNDYLEYDEEGNKRIYVPSVSFVKKGSIIGYDDETSLISKGEPKDYWNTEHVKNLKLKLSKYMYEIKNNECGTCN